MRGRSVLDVPGLIALRGVCATARFGELANQELQFRAARRSLLAAHKGDQAAKLEHV